LRSSSAPELIGGGRDAADRRECAALVANGVLLAPMLSFAMAALTLFYLDVSSREAA